MGREEGLHLRAAAQEVAEASGNSWDEGRGMDPGWSLGEREGQDIRKMEEGKVEELRSRDSVAPNLGLWTKGV